MIDFATALQFIRQFKNGYPATTQGAFVLTAWTADDPPKIAAMVDYPLTYSGTPRYIVIPQSSRRKIVNASNVDVAGAKEAYYDTVASGIAIFCNLHGGHKTTPNVVMGYAVALQATFDDMILPAKRVHLPILRSYLDEAQGDTPYEPNTPFSASEVSVVSTWFNNHGITNTAFAKYFDSTPTKIAEWMQNNPRWDFAKRIATAWENLQ